MKRLSHYVHSRVARRILGLFVLCAMLPVATLGIISLRQVSSKLREQTQERLHHTAKNVGMTILDSLSSIKTRMEEVVASKADNPEIWHNPGRNPLRQQLLSLVLHRPASSATVLFGDISPLPPLSEAARNQLAAGKALIYCQPGSGGKNRLFMMIAAGKAPDRPLLIGEIATAPLGERIRDALPPLTEATVLDATGKALYTSPAFPQAATSGTKTRLQQQSCAFEFQQDRESYLANYWRLFLKGAYFSDDWKVVVTQSRNDAFLTLDKFTRTFILLLVLTLLVVFYVSSTHIRRSLIPLMKLKEGTHQISRGDFASRIHVHSGDEFEDVANSFNIMAEHLQRQFTTLSETGQIVRIILTALDRGKVAVSVIEKMQNVVPCDQVALFLMEAEGTKEHSAIVYFSDAIDMPPAYATVSPQDMVRLEKAPEGLLVDSFEFPDFLSTVKGGGFMTYALLPIRLHRNIGGILAMGYLQTTNPPQEDLLRARQIADQIGVAIVNADLLDELAQLSWGTLTALARAVDANSPWTAGHSERVTDLSLKIGREMGLSPQELQMLHRGGLLHDIGKIAVPASVLDKAGKLTKEEVALIQEHPAKGAMILEPIHPYRNIIPLVEQHHEWFNGQGYPLGLAGEDISLGARILAVADVYDALLSDRPYRPGWAPDAVWAYIEERAGQQFDPAVVEAFLRCQSGTNGVGTTLEGSPSDATRSR